MKRIALALAFVSASVLSTFATVSEARSIDPTKVVASVQGLESGITAVDFLEDGRLFVTKEDGTHTVKRLSDSAKNLLLASVRGLANVEVTESTHLIVCMMMPQPTLSELSISDYDYETQEFASVKRGILSASGCWVSHKVKPTHDHDVISANVLRGQLVALAMATLK